jgi:hypothetical protein
VTTTATTPATAFGVRPAAGAGAPSVPPAAVPLTFLGAAGVGLIGFAVALAIVAPAAVVAPTAPKVVAAVHLAMLGFLSTAVLGAMHQFTPVIAARPLRSATAAYVTAALFAPGAWTIAAGFATGHPAVVSIGGILVSAGIVLAVWNLSGPLSARGKGTPVLGLRLALGFLVITAGFGVTYAFDRHEFWFGLLPRRVLAHAHLGLLGWLGLAYVSVAEKLWPMFLLAHRPAARSGDVAVRLLPAGAILLATGLLVPSKPVAVAGGIVAVAGLAAHIISLAGVIRHRRRPLELLHAFVLTSAGCLAVAAMAGAVAGLAPVSVVWRIRLTSVEVLGLVGWLGLAIIGHAHKIVPFIAWSALRARGVTTGPDGRPLLFAHLFHHPTARLTFVAAAAGIVAALAGAATATALLVRFGGVLLAAAGVLVVTNLAYGPRRVSTERRNRVPVPDPEP